MNADRPVVITTTSDSVVGRRTEGVHGVVVGEGATAAEAIAGLEYMASEYDADAVVDVRVMVYATSSMTRYCAYGTAIAIASK